VLEGKVETGRKVLIAGGGLIAAETAEFLGERGKDVTIVEMQPEVAMNVHMYIKPFLMHALDKYGVTLLTDSKIVKFVPSGLVYEKEGREYTLEEYDTIILALGTRSYDPLGEDAKKLVDQVFVIGDALKAGSANHATESALAVAASL